MALAYKIVATPIGHLKLIASDSGLVAILWPDDDPRRVRLEEHSPSSDHPVLAQSERELAEYFAGTRTLFTMPLDLRGTAFQRSVWNALLAIPYAQTRTYGQLAAQLGNVNATRAVGAANGRNPVSVIVPCHRVVGSSGKLTGFAGGLEIKAHLLALEQGTTQAQSPFALTSAEL